MAPPESNWDSTAVDQEENVHGDFDRTNYENKIKDYVKKVETFDWSDQKAAIGELR